MATEQITSPDNSNIGASRTQDNGAPVPFAGGCEQFVTAATDITEVRIRDNTTAPYTFPGPGDVVLNPNDPPLVSNWNTAPENPGTRTQIRNVSGEPVTVHPDGTIDVASAEIISEGTTDDIGIHILSNMTNNPDWQLCFQTAAPLAFSGSTMPDPTDPPGLPACFVGDGSVGPQQFDLTPGCQTFQVKVSAGVVEPNTGGINFSSTTQGAFAFNADTMMNPGDPFVVSQWTAPLGQVGYRMKVRVVSGSPQVINTAGTIETSPLDDSVIEVCFDKREAALDAGTTLEACFDSRVFVQDPPTPLSITDPPDQTGNIGDELCSPFQVTGGTAPYNVVADNGATVNDLGGGDYEVCYTPTDETPVPVTVTATDSLNEAVDTEVTFTGQEPAPPPVFKIAPPQYIDAPPVEPTRFGLFSVAHIMTAEGHGLNGVEWEPLACEPAEIGEVVCGPTPEKTRREGEGLVTTQPFFVYGSYFCKAMGRSFEDARRRAIAHLELGEERAVETALMTGISSPSFLDTPDYPVVDLTPPSGALTVLGGVATLEEFLGEHYGGAGVLHMAKATATFGIQANLVYRENDTQLSTWLGTLVSAGGGYVSNNGPDGTPAPAGEAWIYATGRPHITRGEVMVNPPDLEGMNTSTNDLLILAERIYTVGWDCETAAVRVKLACCC